MPGKGTAHVDTWRPEGEESSDFKEPIEAKWGCDLLNEQV